MRRTAFERSACSLAILAAGLAFAAPVRGQLRGLPVFFDPTYSYDTRVGLDVGHGGELDGLTIAVGASRLFYIGNCARVAASASLGSWNPPGDGFDANLGAGVSASVLMNPCPLPNSVSNPTFRLFTGGGMLRVGGHSVFDVPVGIGAGYMLPVPIARIELWTTPRLHYRESPAGGGSRWDFAASLGLNIGVGAVAGLRVAADCCRGGIGGAYGLSLWF